MKLVTLLLPVEAMTFPSGGQNRLSACAVTSFRHLQPGPVVVVSPHSSGSLATELLKELHASGKRAVFTLSDHGAALGSVQKPSNIIILPDPRPTERTSNLSELAALNSRARFFILTLDEAMTIPILQELHDLNVVNAVILVLTQNYSRVNAYTWFPYRPPGLCRTQDINPVLLDVCVKEINVSFDRNVSLFPQKIPPDLYGCPITISTFPWPPFIVTPQAEYRADKVFYTEGLEVKLVSTITQSMNATVHYLSPPANDSKWGARTPSGLWTGLLGEVFHKRADVAFASFTATEERMQYMETTVTYWTNSVVWVVPRPQFVSGWRSLLEIFRPTMWGVVLVTYLLGSTSLWGLARTGLRPIEPAVYRNPGSCLMTTWALSLETGAHVQPRGTVMRLMFICWVMYCLQISTAYKSSLISVLSNPRLDPAILNMRQLEESGLDFHYTVGLLEYFDDAADVSMRRMRDSLRFCKNITVCLNQVAFKGNIALVSDQWYVAYLIPRLYLDSNGRPLMQTVPEEVLSYHVVMIMSKGNVLLDRFNGLISRVTESGLMQKWAKDIKNTRNLGTVSQGAAGGRRLSISHLQSLFLLLLLGVGLASVVLMAEIVISKSICFHVRKGM